MAYQINKRAHKPRKVSEKAPMKVRVARFLERQGFYVILLVCLGIVGVTAFLTLSGSDQQTPQQQVELPAQPDGQEASGQEEVLLATPAPTLRPTFTPIPSMAATAEPSPEPSQSAQPSQAPEDSSVPAIAQVTDDAQATPEPTEKPKSESKTLSFPTPVSGTLSVKFAEKNLIYSKTLKQWTTHMGIDIEAADGTPVKAVLGGKVESAEKDAWLGYKIVIAHDNDLKTVYACLKDDGGLKKGQAVNAGETIGKVGSSALAECEDGPHIHFEVYQKKKALDPEQLINNLNKPMPESE